MRKINAHLLFLVFNLFSNGILAQQINGANMISNPIFDTDLSGWTSYFDYFWDSGNALAAHGDVSVDARVGYTGKALKVTITNAGTAKYSVQVGAAMPLVAGKKYSMKFKASADGPRTVFINLQQNEASKTDWYQSPTINLTTAPTVFGPYFYTATSTDTSNLFKFYLGGGGIVNGIAGYFDDVEVCEMIDPNSTVPDAPIIETATAGSGEATISFTAPINTGGLAIKSFTVSSFPDGIKATGTKSPITLTGLTNGKSYTFSVNAYNAAGTSTPSSVSISVTPIFRPTVYYVSVTGNDQNNGNSIDKPFKSIQKAADKTNPGDIINIMPGTYNNINNGGYGSDILKITRSGSEGMTITYQAYDSNNQPILKMNLFGTGTKTTVGWMALRIEGASYITIKNLKVIGANDDLTLAKGEEIYNYHEAEKAKNNGYATTDWNYVSTTNTNGIGVDREKLPSYDKNKTELENYNNFRNPHHITVEGCEVSKFAGSGIGCSHADYILFQGNIVHDNSWYTIWATSGMGVAQGVHFDDFTGYKSIIKNNIVYGNKTLVKWEATNDYSDGNGIIADLNQVAANIGLSCIETYNGKTLFLNNICFNNGGSGLHSVTATNVDFINNIAYKNGTRSQNAYGAYANIFFCCGSPNNIVINNIIYAETGKPCTSPVGTDNKNSYYANNVYFNDAKVILGKNDVIADPKFANASIDASLADFHVLEGSPAVDKGVALFTDPTDILAFDINGIARPRGNAVDAGAYELDFSTALNEILKNNTDFSVFPNPTKNNFTIVDLNKFIIKQIELYYIDGKLLKVLKNVTSNQNTINLESANAGIYILKIQTPGQNYFMKIVKE